MPAERGGSRFSGGMKENYTPPPSYTPEPVYAPAPVYTPPPAYTPPPSGYTGRGGSAPAEVVYKPGRAPEPTAPAPAAPGGSGPSSPSTPGSPAVPGSPVIPPADNSVTGISLFKAALAQFGIEATTDLLNWAKQKVVSGSSPAEVLIELRQRPEHKQRFGAFHKLAGSEWAINEGEQIELEQSYISLMRSYGLPEGFYDQSSDLTNFITKRMSPAELRDRLEAHVEDMYNSDPAILEELAKRGLGEGEMLAGYIDPDRSLPVIEKAQRSARIGGAARRAGFGFIPLGVADDLDSIGVTAQQAQEGFSELAQSRELFTGLTGTTEDGISQERQVAATFQGDSEAANAIRRRRRQRVAAFESGGGLATGNKGIVGLASAATT